MAANYFLFLFNFYFAFCCAWVLLIVEKQGFWKSAKKCLFILVFIYCVRTLECIWEYLKSKLSCVFVNYFFTIFNLFLFYIYFFLSSFEVYWKWNELLAAVSYFSYFLFILFCISLILILFRTFLSTILIKMKKLITDGTQVYHFEYKV